MTDEQLVMLMREHAHQVRRMDVPPQKIYAILTESADRLESLSTRLHTQVEPEAQIFEQHGDVIVEKLDGLTPSEVFNQQYGIRLLPWQAKKLNDHFRAE